MSCNKIGWRKVQIGEVCNIRRGASPRPIQKYISIIGIPWVKIADATACNSKYIKKTKEFIIEEGKEKSRFIKEGTLILSNSATPGIPKFMGIDACVHDGWLILDKFKGIDKEFLYYILIQNRRNLLSLSNGSVFRNLKTDIVKNFEVNLPQLKEQKAIVKILSDLDEKIEINNKINKNLEEMAGAIFKRWFVDFEFPDSEGKPYKSNGGEMVESELGMIPKGWFVKELNKIVDVKDGTHDSPKPKQEGYRLITSKHIKGNKILYDEANFISKEDYEKVNLRSKVDKNDILITMIGTVGNLIIVDKEDIDFAIKNIGLIKSSQEENFYEYLYLYLKSKKMTNHIISRLVGSTQKYISLKELRIIPVIIPSEDIKLLFKKIIKDIFVEIKIKLLENEKLEMIRDTLLPKLMSGEVRVSLD